MPKNKGKVSDIRHPHPLDETLLPRVGTYSCTKADPLNFREVKIEGEGRTRMIMVRSGFQGLLQM